MIPDVISYVEEKYGISDVEVTWYGYPLSNGAFGLNCGYRLFDVGEDWQVVYINNRNQFYDNGQANDIINDFINKIYTPKITETENKYNIKIQSDKITLNHLNVKPFYCAFHNKYNGDIEEFLKEENPVINLDYMIFMDKENFDYKAPMFEIRDFLKECGEINRVDMYGCTSDFGEFYSEFRTELKGSYYSSLENYFESSPNSFCSYSVYEDNFWVNYNSTPNDSELQSKWYEKKYIELFPGVKVTSAYPDFTFEEDDIKFEKVFSNEELYDILYEYEISKNSPTGDTSNSNQNNDTDTSKNYVNLTYFPQTDAYRITFSDRLKNYISENNEKYNFSKFGFKCYFMFDEPTKDSDVFEKYVCGLNTDEDGKILSLNNFTETINPYLYQKNYKPSKYDGLKGSLYDDYICLLAKYYRK